MKTWFEVAWHICEQKHGISALGLNRGMGFGSYHTARERLQRMRLVMADPGRTLLNGEVEVDETFIGGVRPGKRGRGAAGKTLAALGPVLARPLPERRCIFVSWRFGLPLWRVNVRRLQIDPAGRTFVGQFRHCVPRRNTLR